MKIEDLLLLPHFPEPRPSRGPAGEKFADCLSEALASASQTVEGLPAVGDLSPDKVGDMPAELAEAVLARLEIFQTCLARGEITLKKMAPLIQKLEEDSLRLKEAAQELPENSP
ncbi:MAG: hypothetical protein JRI59_07950, partial [Deltaproteobacteria bacterium]|nr:hypothetical protein [Deltaproteobacteria bacterium]